jgi:2-polyprenyl-3-methyl-5-hydroxy-6-metoxy-1,4-benzoquinol methylase
MNPLTKEQKHQEEEYTFPYHYNDLASEHNKILRSTEYLDLLDQVKNTLNPFNGQAILDVGCGDGRLCYQIKNENCKIVGVDYSERAISFARAFNPSVDFYVQDIENLNLPLKYDVVILMEIIEHFIPAKIPVILSNIQKVLKDDGKLIITVPSTNISLHPKHYQHFTEESLAKTLKSYFKIIKINGYHKTCFKKSVFNFLLKFGHFLYPFRNKIGLMKSYFTYIDRYYKKNISTGKPGECDGLIAVCVKDLG